jgi:hypothetical protein
MQAVVIMGHALAIFHYTPVQSNVPDLIRVLILLHVYKFSWIYWQDSFISKLILPVNLWIWRKHWLFKFIDGNFRKDISFKFVDWMKALFIQIHQNAFQNWYFQ